MSTSNKIALVTGGSRGLGRDMALRIGKKGMDVILTYQHKKEEAEAVAAEIEKGGQKALALQLNVGDMQSFPAFFEQLQTALRDKFGAARFDFLVNNAGVGINALIPAATEAQFDALLNVHFKGTFFFTQQALALINDGGRIINISTGLTRVSFPGSCMYACMKSALETYTRYLAKELGARGIAANIVAPGAIETDFGEATLRNKPEVKAHVAAVTALGRTGVPEDIGGVVAFLCTEDARWVNAQRIEVSGGMLI